MLKTEKIKIIEELSDNANIFFHSFTDVDENTLVADSHFLRFTFGPNHVTVSDKYILPGKIMKQYISECLPYTLVYNTDKFLQVLLEVVDDIHTNLVMIEIREEENI